jgi:beta-phosphoglucomutase-like phosphatase (HAD superfamily)
VPPSLASPQPPGAQLSVSFHLIQRFGDPCDARPAPDLLLEACRELQTDPGRAISLTHSGAGVVAAKSIGMPVIGVASGPEAEALRAYGADDVVPALGSLLDRSLSTA